MRKLAVFVVIMLAYGVWDHGRHPEVGRQAARHNEVIMYSLTTCGYCKAKARELQAAGIAYSEYYIDKDADRRNELNRKLEQAGFPPRGYGTPILDVHGTLLPNNPSLESIRRHLRDRAARAAAPNPFG